MGFLHHVFTISNRISLFGNPTPPVTYGIVNPSFDEGAVGQFDRQSFFGWNYGGTVGSSPAPVNATNQLGESIIEVNANPVPNASQITWYENTGLIRGGVIYELTINGRDIDTDSDGFLKVDAVIGGVQQNIDAVINMDGSGIFKDYTVAFDASLIGDFNIWLFIETNTGSNFEIDSVILTVPTADGGFVLRDDGSYVLRDDGSRIIRTQTA